MQQKKYIQATVLCLLIAMICTLSGCFNADKSPKLINGVSPDNITFQKKYYLLDDRTSFEDNDYFIFYEDGTAELRYSNAWDEEATDRVHYTVHLKWIAPAEDTLIVLGNGTTYHDDHTGALDRHYIRNTLGVTKDILVRTSTDSITYYICEDYIEEIPDYGEILD